MIKSGVCSVTFRDKEPKEIIEIVSKAGIQSIEWGSDVHVKAGDVKTAQKVREWSEDAGVDVSSYGSYYRLGMNHDVAPYLESAKALGARQIRIWGGLNPSSYMSFDVRLELIREAKEISRMAAAYGISLSTECHSGTVTDIPESLLYFMYEVNEPNFCSYWQELLHIQEERQLHSLKTLYSSGKLTNLHVYQFDNMKMQRKQTLLREGRDKWMERLMVFKSDIQTRYAILEFVKDGDLESFIDDAKVLTEIIEKVKM